MPHIKQTLQSMDKIFKARSIAVVGASNNAQKLGYMTLDSLLRGGYEGQIYPINPRGGEIMGLKAYGSLDELPEPPELVAVIIPAKFVAGVLKQAAKMGVKGGLILSAGFREDGRMDLEEEIAVIPKRYGLRFVGPNVQGINYLPNKMCVMFYPVIKTQGPIAIVSQSGTITAALSEWAADEGLGISAAINLGNQVDLCESDYLDFLAADENTKAIAMYIEGLKDGRQFIDTLRRVAPQKPIAILKGGRTGIGQKSAASHTGSLAGSYQVFSAACRQLGVILAGDLETLYDSIKALSTLKLPNGNRIFSISTSGGAGTLAADEANSNGLVLPDLPPALVEELRQIDLPPLATLDNPLDLADINKDGFYKALIIADKYDLADVFLMNFGDPVIGAGGLAKDLRTKLNAQVVVTYFGGGNEEKKGRVEIQNAGIPVFPSPNRAMRGIGAAAWRAEYFRRRKQQK